MYYYKQTDLSLWQVGCETSNGWCTESIHIDPSVAADRVRYLNGGYDPKKEPERTAYKPTRQDYLLAKILGGMAANPAYTQATPRAIASLAIDQLEEFLDLEAEKIPFTY